MSSSSRKKARTQTEENSIMTSGGGANNSSSSSSMEIVVDGDDEENAKALLLQWSSFLEETNFDRSIVDDLQEANKRDYRSDEKEIKVALFCDRMMAKYPDFKLEHAEQAMNILQPDSAESIAYSHRGPSIADGLDTKLVHTFDLVAFTKRIDELFEWHGDNSTVSEKFLAPYFALIQSSGMGKTKLCTEFRKIYNKTPEPKCKTILCIDAKLSKEKEDAYFDHKLIVDNWAAREIMDKVWEKLDKILADSGVGSGQKLVLLFDEALESGDTVVASA